MMPLLPGRLFGAGVTNIKYASACPMNYVGGRGRVADNDIVRDASIELAYTEQPPVVVRRRAQRLYSVS